MAINSNTDEDIITLYTSDVMLEYHGITFQDIQEAIRYQSNYNDMYSRHKELLMEHKKQKELFYKRITNGLYEMYPLAIAGIIAYYVILRKYMDFSIVGACISSVIFGSVSGIYFGIFTLLPLYVSQIIIKIIAKILTYLRYEMNPIYLHWTPPTPPKNFNHVQQYISMIKSKGINIDFSTIQQKRHNQCKSFPHTFTGEYSKLSGDIIEKVTNGTIKRFNENMASFLFGDDYPAHFTSFDCYSIFWYKDWGSWELREQIRDCIESFLELEYDNLSGPEKFVLDCEYSTKEDVSTKEQIIEELYDSFMAEVEAHLELKKIQQYLYRF